MTMKMRMNNKNNKVLNNNENDLIKYILLIIS
jgi:hypothetical protein